MLSILFSFPPYFDDLYFTDFGLSIPLAKVLQFCSALDFFFTILTIPYVYQRCYYHDEYRYIFFTSCEIGAFIALRSLPFIKNISRAYDLTVAIFIYTAMLIFDNFFDLIYGYFGRPKKTPWFFGTKNDFYYDQLGFKAVFDERGFYFLTIFIRFLAVIGYSIYFTALGKLLDYLLITYKQTKKEINEFKEERRESFLLNQEYEGIDSIESDKEQMPKCYCPLNEPCICL